MEFRDFGADPAGQFEFEMERVNYPVHASAAVEEGAAVVRVTFHSPEATISQPFLTHEIRHFAASLIQFADTAEKMLAREI